MVLTRSGFKHFAWRTHSVDSMIFQRNIIISTSSSVSEKAVHALLAKESCHVTWHKVLRPFAGATQLLN